MPMSPARTRSSASWKIADSARSRIDIRLIAGGQRLLLNRGGRMNQTAQDGLFLHDARVVLHVRDARQPIRQLRNICDATGRFEHAVAAQGLHQRHRIDCMPLFAELHHAFENVAVLRKEEILGAKAFDGGIQRVIVEQHGAEDAALGFDVAGQRSFEGDFGRHLLFALFSPNQSGRASPMFRFRSVDFRREILLPV